MNLRSAYRSITGKLLISIIAFASVVLLGMTYFSARTQKNIAIQTAARAADVTATSMLSGLNEMMLNGSISNPSNRKALLSLFYYERGFII